MFYFAVIKVSFLSYLSTPSLSFVFRFFSAYILENITPRSLVIVDELGRGTSNIDGVSLAFAIAERLANASTSTSTSTSIATSSSSGQSGLSSPVSQPYTLFVTHYPQLTALADMYPNVANVHLKTSIDVQAMTALAVSATAVTRPTAGLGQEGGGGGGVEQQQQQQQQHIKFLHQVGDMSEFTHAHVRKFSINAMFAILLLLFCLFDSLCLFVAGGHRSL